VLLAVDIGNTNITIGIFDNNELIERHRFESYEYNANFDFESELRTIISGKDIEGCVIESVVDELTYSVKQSCNRVLGVNSILLTHDSDTGIGLNVEKPYTIGADRLANVCAASKYNLPAIVVDIGTAITFDILDEDKNFIGGVIMPGVNMCIKALAEGTSKLNEIEIDNSPAAIGDTTETCILSGVLRGAACAIEGLLTQCETELGAKATVIMTGGQAELISQYMSRTPDFINKNLTLEGLQYYYLKSQQQ